MKEIPLSRGFVALVDDEDYEFINRWKWSAKPHRHTIYADRGEYSGSRQTHHRMHRVILGVTIPETIVDHIDGNGLNNQKSNLRIVTRTQNRHNCRGAGASGYPGVTKRGNRWVARIRPKGQYFYLGAFATEIEAAAAYSKKASELYGNFVRKFEELKEAQPHD